MKKLLTLAFLTTLTLGTLSMVSCDRNKIPEIIDPNPDDNKDDSTNPEPEKPKPGTEPIENS